MTVHKVDFKFLFWSRRSGYKMKTGSMLSCVSMKTWTDRVTSSLLLRGSFVVCGLFVGLQGL